jgi:hypothetical protein
VAEQPAVTVQVEIELPTQVLHTLQKRGIALVSATWRMKLLCFVQLIKVMQFLHWRHPEIGMSLQLPIKPGGACFLRSHAQEIGARVTGEAVKPIAVAVVPITMIAVAGFEWPVPTHHGILSIRALKSKPGVSGCGEVRQS